MPQLDMELVRHALTTARRHGFAEVGIDLGGDSFTASLEPMAPQPAPVQTSAEIAQIKADGEIRATLVGYYRPCKTPLQVGLQITKGQVVAIIAALGIANDVESNVDGEVTEVLVTPNQPVEYGQVLAKVKTA